MERKMWERVVVVVVVVLAALIISARFYVGGKAEKGAAAQDELRAVRTAVELYAKVNKGYPPDLKTLVNEKYSVGSRHGPYLTGVKLDKENYPVDSFGRRFVYEPKSGWVELASR